MGENTKHGSKKKKKRVVSESASVCSLAWALPPPLGDIIIEPEMNVDNIDGVSTPSSTPRIKGRSNYSVKHLIPHIRPSSGK